MGGRTPTGCGLDKYETGGTRLSRPMGGRTPTGCGRDKYETGGTRLSRPMGGRTPTGCGHFKVLFAPRDVSLPKALCQFELCLRVTQFQGRVEQKLQRLACIHRKPARTPSIGPGECAVGRSRCEARLDRRPCPRHGIRFANHPSHSREEIHRHQIAEFAAPARQRDDFRRQGRFPGLIVRACVGRMHPFQRQFRIGLGTFGLHLPFKVLDPSDDVRLAIDLREHVRVVDMPLELIGEPMVGLANQENQKGKTR